MKRNMAKLNDKIFKYQYTNRNLLRVAVLIFYENYILQRNP